MTLAYIPEEAPNVLEADPDAQVACVAPQATQGFRELSQGVNK